MKKALIEHREVELNLRSKKFRIENEVENWIAKYDDFMMEKQAQLEEIQEAYDEEKEQLDELKERFAILKVRSQIVKQFIIHAENLFENINFLVDKVFDNLL